MSNTAEQYSLGPPDTVVAPPRYIIGLTSQVYRQHASTIPQLLTDNYYPPPATSPGFFLPWSVSPHLDAALQPASVAVKVALNTCRHSYPRYSTDNVVVSEAVYSPGQVSWLVPRD